MIRWTFIAIIFVAIIASLETLRRGFVDYEQKKQEHQYTVSSATSSFEKWNCDEYIREGGLLVPWFIPFYGPKTRTWGTEHERYCEEWRSIMEEPEPQVKDIDFMRAWNQVVRKTFNSLIVLPLRGLFVEPMAGTSEAMAVAFLEIKRFLKETWHSATLCLYCCGYMHKDQLDYWQWRLPKTLKGKWKLGRDECDECICPEGGRFM